MPSSLMAAIFEYYSFWRSLGIRGGTWAGAWARGLSFPPLSGGPTVPSGIGRGDDTVGNPHRAQISQFELFELILLLKFDKRFPVEQFEAAASQSAAVPSPLLYFHSCVHWIIYNNTTNDTKDNDNNNNSNNKHNIQLMIRLLVTNIIIIITIIYRYIDR